MKKLRLSASLLILVSAILLVGLLSESRVAKAVACSPVTATIASGFSTGGAGEFCWEAADLGAYVQSWGTDVLQINGVDYTNLYVPTDNILRETNGKFYVYYRASTANGHFHATGDSGITSCSARWCSASQFSSVTFAPYVVYNNVWGAATGTGQTIQAQNYNNWSVQATFPETSGVKSYPNTSLDMNGKTLSTLGSCTSGFRITPPTGGSWEASYDIWVPSEVMIWTYKTGLVGPIARGWNDDGTPIPEFLGVNIAGHTWDVYRGGANVVSLIRTTNTTAGTIDVLAILNWIADQGWISRTANLDKFQFGFEITSAPGGLNFVLNDYWMSCGGRGTTGGTQPTSPPPTTAPTRTRTPVTPTSVVPTNTPTRTGATATRTPTRTATRTGATATRTATRATTIVPTRTNTGVPPTVPPTATSGGTSTLKVQYRAADTNAADNQIKPHFNIVNTGSASVNMSELKIRYYFTKDAGGSMAFNCDWASKGCGNISGAFAATTGTNTDTYLEVSFTTGAGSIAAGQSSGEMQIRLNKSDWTNFNESNDYSFDPTKTAFADWTRVVLLRNGTIVWGTQP